MARPHPFPMTPSPNVEQGLVRESSCPGWASASGRTIAGGQSSAGWIMKMARQFLELQKENSRHGG
jgi:hypothetical protein